MALTLKQALAQFWIQITNKFVSKENGKGLSTNDFTTEEKNKLASLENIPVDTTLTASNAAADAKTVGDKITALNEKIGVLIVNVSEVSTFVAAPTPTYVADKTFAEIEAAIYAGQYVIANYGSLYATLSIYDEGSRVMFTNYVPTIVQAVVEINADDTVTVVMQNFGDKA